jgi:hypothetical protein
MIIFICFTLVVIGENVTGWIKINSCSVRLHGSSDSADANNEEFTF